MPEGSKDVKVGELIALTVEQGEDWKTVEMPEGGAAAPSSAPAEAAAPSAPSAASSAPPPPGQCVDLFEIHRRILPQIPPFQAKCSDACAITNDDFRNDNKVVEKGR